MSVNNEFNQLETLSVGDIPDNSFLVIRVDVAGPMEKYIAATQIANGLRPYFAIFKNKNVNIMVMMPNERFEIITETEMNSAGWYRKTTT